ncbi:MAG TPA: cysteine--tRNA ligase [Candidatus Limnocylindrales bacterium]|nr:cysteine--tRNA ligase [Candidatus Limnocylindrales bacterium]
MTLRLRDTLTRRIRPVEPIEPGLVRMYSCGPTVYRYAHIGNLRTFLLADLIRRACLWHGLRVTHVQNITDVGHLRDERFDRGEDPMLMAAGLEDKTPGEIADAYEAAFHADKARLNILPAHAYPRATEHIPEMIALAERLEDGGHAYRGTSGTLYYDVSSFAGYGRLSGNSLDALRAGHRGEIEPDKRDPADFALWKPAGEGRILSWPTTRWGNGFPGWHLECSAMAMRCLGPEFDIHTGGVDNIFPHHEDEIAQTAALTGRVPARAWVHGAFLTSSGRKMAKSAGNFVRITELAGGSIDPLAFRYLALSSRYAHKLDLTDESLAAAARGLSSLRGALVALGRPPLEGPWDSPQALEAGSAPDRPRGRATAPNGHGIPPADPLPRVDRAHEPPAPLSAAGRALHDQLAEAIDNDLDTPTALATVRRILTDPELVDHERRWLVLDVDFVLGLGLHQAWDLVVGTEDREVPPEVWRMALERTAARQARDFTAADGLRDRILALGWDLVDRQDGSSDVHRRTDF